jgi:uncharacterized protein (DUF924 family)
VDRKILGEVYRYWFGSLAGHDDIPKEKAGIWFKRSDATDDFIRDNFGAYIPQAATIDWNLAELTREEQIALVVLFDQFPRNIFRTSGDAFAYDAKARSIALPLIEAGWRRYFHVEQGFLFLPLEHSEDLADQDYGVQLFAERAVSATGSLKEDCRIGLDYATRHRDLIRKFGRFPHRNAVLGRLSTPEEEAFFKEHGRGF